MLAYDGQFCICQWVKVSLPCHQAVPPIYRVISKTRGLSVSCNEAHVRLQTAKGTFTEGLSLRWTQRLARICVCATSKHAGSKRLSAGDFICATLTPVRH